MDTDWNEEAAARAAIRDEVERVLRKASEGVDIDAVHRRWHVVQPAPQFLALGDEFPACTGGPCQGGHKLCPSPDACERATDDDALGAARGIIVGIAGALAIWAAAAALWLSLR